MLWSDVALLTPVPYEHLVSGLPICEAMGRVAFGSDSVEVMSIVAAEARDAQVRVLFYASHAPDAFPARVTWSGTFVGLEGTQAGRHPHHDRLRPPTTASDGPWQIFYEVSDLIALPSAQQLPLTRLKKRKGALLSKSFLPIGPVLIENPL